MAENRESLQFGWRGIGGHRSKPQRAGQQRSRLCLMDANQFSLGEAFPLPFQIHHLAAYQLEATASGRQFSDVVPRAITFGDRRLRQNGKGLC